MSMRNFADSDGTEWQAFDVIPQQYERRRYDRRADDPPPEGEGGDDDERRETDRRLTVGYQSPLSAKLSHGWLCFEHGTDRRRLAPIPPDWRECSEEALRAYCHEAQPVQRIFASDGRPVQRRA